MKSQVLRNSQTTYSYVLGAKEGPARARVGVVARQAAAGCGGACLGTILPLSIAV